MGIIKTRWKHGVDDDDDGNDGSANDDDEDGDDFDEEKVELDSIDAAGLHIGGAQSMLSCVVLMRPGKSLAVQWVKTRISLVWRDSSLPMHWLMNF